ncbi:regulatory protein, tetR family [Paramicrobacterium humi]|uniref:Regulatory protein, tetR family n=2 Tax=Paramicrobacterium humi TaxID=640635 RepID=A0A1H4JUD4_9MICO|nr:regulatory protein, tetR family [Microbacterium humi]
MGTDGRTRLIGAAIESFAASGFGVPVRAIADRAGVTAGLIRHHFGSKDALREVCDAEVLARYRSLKRDAMAQSPLPMFGAVSKNPGNAVLIVYVVRAAREGGETARRFLERFIAEALAISREATHDGLLVSSRDEQARARYLITMTLGALSIQLALKPEIALADFPRVLDEVMAETTLPALEIFTEGVFADRRYLDAYLEYLHSDSAPDGRDQGVGS